MHIEFNYDAFLRTINEKTLTRRRGFIHEARRSGEEGPGSPSWTGDSERLRSTKNSAREAECGKVVDDPGRRVGAEFEWGVAMLWRHEDGPAALSAGETERARPESMSTREARLGWNAEVGLKLDAELVREAELSEEK